jgi:AcrR family transcriptional regulator
MQNASAPRRHPEQGGYARGEETRARIVVTALRIFGELGYDQASTRQIAAAANVNPPALQYYFHGKEGLHRACAQHIIDRASVFMSPAFARASAALQTRVRDEAIAALFGLLDALADGLAAAGSESWSRFIARGRADGAGPAIALLRERIGTPLFEAVAQLLCILTGKSVVDETVRLRALAILGQAYWFHTYRDNTLLLMHWSAFTPENLTLIKAMVREHTQAILNAIAGPAAERRSAALRGSRRKRC